jgi:hypothetical protein
VARRTDIVCKSRVATDETTEALPLPKTNVSVSVCLKKRAPWTIAPRRIDSANPVGKKRTDRRRRMGSVSGPRQQHANAQWVDADGGARRRVCGACSRFRVKRANKRMVNAFHPPPPVSQSVAEPVGTLARPSLDLEHTTRVTAVRVSISRMSSRFIARPQPPANYQSTQTGCSTCQ